MIREVILQLIPFDDDFARNNYGEILEALEPLPDFMNLPPTLDPLFGRKELQNVFLTSVGMIGCKRVLFALKSTIEDVKVCMLLPRVTQLLLWFMREHEVFQVVQVLVNESKIRQDCEKHSYFFPFSLEKQKQVAMAIAGLAGVKTNKYFILMVKDMVYNFVVGYISPSFLPIVMMYFIVDGIGGMLRLLVPLIKIIAPFIEPLTSSVSSTAEFLIEAKRISKDNFDITMMMKVLNI